MHFLTITLFGYGLFGLLLFSIYISYSWLKGSKEDKPGCLSVGFYTLVAFSALMFPFVFSVTLYENYSDYAKIGVIAFWVLVFGSYFYAKITNNTKHFWDFLLTIVKYVLVAIFFVLFCILYFGMFYYIYKVLFTNQEVNFELWVGFLCVFFTSVLTLIIFSIPLMEKSPKSESTFYDLTKALKKPQVVTRLDLSEQNLSEFPLEIFTMPNILYLDLSKNNIRTIPFEIRNLKYLEDLYLKDNPISVVDKVKMRKEFSKITIIF